MVGRDASGKSSTRAPLANWYSVTPSIVATFTGGPAVELNAPAHNQPITNNKRIGEPSVTQEVLNGKPGRRDFPKAIILGSGPDEATNSASFAHLLKTVL